MCGIAGILRVHAPGGAPASQEAIPDAWLDLLDGAIAHRGPDGRGRFRDRATRGDGRTVDVALVHRRLAVIDPAGGAQPLVTGDGPAHRAVVFNGCIYNHRELRRELEREGCVFTTHHSDTEVISHAHARWGDRASARFDGMFAYGVWSRREATLTLARDAAGEKPLYHAMVRDGQGGWVFIFASTAAGVTKWVRQFGASVGGSGRVTCDAHGLLHWLRFGGSLLSPLHEVQECDVRTVMRCGAGGSDHDEPSAGRYADAPIRKRQGGEASPETVDELIGRAVRSRLESDVGLGCFLSGGVDSSLVAWHAARAMRERSGGDAGRLRTFTVQMPDARYDESAFASRAAGIIGSDHATLPCDARPAEHLPMLIGQLGLPFADSSLLPTYWVSDAARKHVKVALTGDAGDELFMGYERHGAARGLTRARGLLRFVPESLGESGHPKSVWSKLGRLGYAARGGYDELLAIFPRPMLTKLAPGLAQRLAEVPAWYPVDSRIPFDAPRRDFDWYLPGDLLRKTDTAAMSVALETRAPFLAREVVDLGLTTPLSVLARGGRKGLLRQAARLHLPSGIVDRPKMGFAIPVGDWLRTDFGGMRALLMDSVNAADAFPPNFLGVELDRRYVGRLIDEHMGSVCEHGQRLYLLMVLAIWCRWIRGV